MEKVEGWATIPPIGILYIASSIRQKFKDCEFNIYDMSLPENTEDNIIKKISEFSPDFFMFSGMYVDKSQLERILGKIKKVFPEIPSIVGGPIATTAPFEILSIKDVDFIVGGEGEFRIINLIENISTFNFMDGIGYIKNNTKIYNPPITTIQDLDSLPFPDWSLIDIKKYSYLPTLNTFVKKTPYIPIVTSRGCPFQCIFCHKTLGKVFRKRSPENIIREIEYICKITPAKEIHIVDDCFNLDMSRAKEFLRLFSQKFPYMTIAFATGIRGDLLDEELISLMKNAGVYHISFAIENVAPNIKKSIKKELDLEKIKENIRLINKYNIFSTAFFMFGFPDETENDLILNFDYAKKLDVDTVSFFRVVPYPGTELENHIKDRTSISASDFHFHSENRNINISKIPDKILSEYRSKVYRKFYLNPFRIFRILRRIPKNFHLFRTIFMEFIERIKF